MRFNLGPHQSDNRMKSPFQKPRNERTGVGLGDRFFLHILLLLWENSYLQILYLLPGQNCTISLIGSDHLTHQDWPAARCRRQLSSKYHHFGRPSCTSCIVATFLIYKYLSPEQVVEKKEQRGWTNPFPELNVLDQALIQT